MTYYIIVMMLQGYNNQSPMVFKYQHRGDFNTLFVFASIKVIRIINTIVSLAPSKNYTAYSLTLSGISISPHSRIPVTKYYINT